VIPMALYFMAAASLSHTFWQEVDMMIENNDIPPYLQDALTHATFEELDLDHDGVATQHEMQEYLAKLTADSADMLEAVKDIPMKYPVFQVTSTMSPEAKDTICMMALAYEEIDFDSALEKYTRDNVFAESVESFFETAPMSVDYDVWHGIGQKEFLPQVYSDELVIPDECLKVRRKLLGPAAMAGVVGAWARWEGFALLVAASVAAAETLGVECTKQDKEDCNWGHWGRVAAVTLLVEHGLVAARYAFTAYFAMTPEVAAAGGTGIRIAGRTIGVPSGLTEAFIPPALVALGHNDDCGFTWLGQGKHVEAHFTTNTDCNYRFPTLSKAKEECAKNPLCWYVELDNSDMCGGNRYSIRPEGTFLHDCCGTWNVWKKNECAGCPAVQTNVDYPGNDLNAGGMFGMVPGHLTRDQCAAWCKADARCAGYTFFKSSTGGDNCSVKSSWVESSRHAGTSCCDSQQITRGVLSGCA